ncbi:NAD(+) diphosphatase [Labilibacter marinus]|uniref:NAD(+) diphosphatase n=1 Tax=Labilibacter marinus TaxID=1477105 RepID=UPI000836D752|nr:NAD(+) diphosphatase [Labilibacter marinus]
MIQDIFPHTFSNEFSTRTLIEDDDYVFLFKEKSLLLKATDSAFTIPRKKDLKHCHSEGIFLFSFNETPCFLVENDGVTEDETFSYHETNSLNTKSQIELDYCSAVGFQLKTWYAQNKFCGTCGTATELKQDERAIICPSCQRISHPNISPAIIVAVICGDNILLARGAHFPPGLFSLIAGYVDVGETVEDAVKRELQEEVGIDIDNFQYHSSQPWPFSSSMMLGFVAKVDQMQAITIDDKEIAEAAWYSKDALPTYPPDRSIAGEIINQFKEGKL